MSKRDIMRRKDKEFFKSIWDSRPHLSEVSGKKLDYDFSPSMYFVFSHVLSKAAYPSYRHDPRNIVLVTLEEHQEWEFGDRKDPKWDFKKKIAEKLIQEYYG